MSILAWIEDQKRLKLLNAPKYVNPASDSSKGLWTRCDKCGVILYIKHLKENQRVCFGCSYHLQMSSQERVENLLDKDSWRPLDETVSPCDPLEFHDQKDYTDRLQEAQERTGLQDAIQTGSGMVDGIPIALGVMDFDFMGGSMGSVVGEKVTRLIEYATQEGLTLVLVCASGGARMQEGVFSLMQMAKISSALQVYQACANLLYISILTSPTTGGVTASFAMLGDIIFAEPKALVAFAGRRVIEQTLCEDLPEDFQTSEYMLHHGLLDLIVPRRFFRQALSESIRLYKNAPFKKPGRIPFGVQNPITFVVEERIRRQWAVGNAPIAHKLSHLLTESRIKNSTGYPTATIETPGVEAPGASTPGVETPYSVLDSVEEMPRDSSNNRVEITQTQLQDKESSSKSIVLNRNGSKRTVSSSYPQEIAPIGSSLQNKENNESLQDEMVEEGEARTEDRNKQTGGASIPVQTQDKVTFKHTTQSGKNTQLSHRWDSNAPLDESLQNDDSTQPAVALIMPEALQDRAALSISDPVDPLLQREAIDYRNILTSFQTMFNLFSKQLAVPYASIHAKNTRLDEQKEDETVSEINKRINVEPKFEQTAYEINSEDRKDDSSQEVANLSGVSTPGASTPGVSTPPLEQQALSNKLNLQKDLLLHSFLTLSENQDSKKVETAYEAGPQTQVEHMSTVNRSNGTDQSESVNKTIQEISQTPSSIRIREDASYPSTNKDSISTSSQSADLQKTAADISMPIAVAGSKTVEPRLSVYRDVLPSSGDGQELVASSSIYVDFLNKSIELSATESVEWRAFYLHQRISQTTGFVEDLAQSLPDYPKHSNEIAFQNMLFYRSICRKLS